MTDVHAPTPSTHGGVTSVLDVVRSLIGTLRTLLVRTLTLAGSLIWLGFWGSVARIHLLHGDVVGLVGTALLGLVPAVATIRWVVPLSSAVRGPLRELVPGRPAED